MKPVIIESPYAGDVERNRAYLNAAILDCVRRGETPYASHKMLVDSLDDLVEEERTAGIHAGFAMAEALGATTARVFYIDHGMSGGMRYGLEHAGKMGQPIVYRTLPRDSKRIWVFVLEFGYWAERQEHIFGAFSSKARAQAAIDEFRADRAAGSPMPDKYWGIDILDSHDPPKPVIVELLLDVPTWVGQ